LAFTLGSVFIATELQLSYLCGVFLKLAFWQDCRNGTGRAIASTGAGEPYMVTYDHYLEEPGALKLRTFQRGYAAAGHDFHAGWLELEYGVKAWWTTDCTWMARRRFTTARCLLGSLENRFRLLQREHFINPVLYIEYEQSAKRQIMKESKVTSGGDHPSRMPKRGRGTITSLS